MRNEYEYSQCQRIVNHFSFVDRLEVMMQEIKPATADESASVTIK